MDHKTIVGLLSGIIIGAVICYLATNTSILNPDQSLKNDALKTSGHGTATGLSGKFGNDFDKAFLDEMIVHHEMAVEMANLALKEAQHQELKDLSNAIISSQDKEINQMKSWRSLWFK